MADLPSQKELMNMPLRAIVAYAVRAARRVQPLFEEGSEREDHRLHSQKIDEAITLTQKWANAEIINRIILEDSYYAALETCIECGNSISIRGVINSAAFSAKVSFTDDIHFAANYATHALTASLTAFSFAFIEDNSENCITFIDDSEIRNSTIIDYQKLLAMNLGEEDRIDASENGPLGPYWPEELEPEWYKELYPQMLTALGKTLSKNVT